MAGHRVVVCSDQTQFMGMFDELPPSERLNVLAGQCYGGVSPNYVASVMLGLETKSSIDIISDEGQKLYVIACRHDGHLLGLASCVFQNSEGSRILYLDLVCSREHQGKLLMNTCLWLAKSAGASLMRLSALPQVIGYYKNKFGFIRHPSACQPNSEGDGVQNLNLKIVRRLLRGWQKGLYINVGTKWFTVGKHEDSVSAGFAMSKCLTRLSAPSLPEFTKSNVDWNHHVGSRPVPQVILPHGFIIEAARVPHYESASKEPAPPPAKKRRV